MPKGANQTRYRKMYTIIPDTCSWTRVILLRLHCSSREVRKLFCFFLLTKEVRDDKMRRIFRKNSSFKRACLVVVHRVRRRLCVVDCVLCDHPRILWWLCKPNLEAQSLEQVGHWNSVVVISAENALWRR